MNAHDVSDRIVCAVRAAMQHGDLSALALVLAEDVRWDGNFHSGCRNRSDALSTLQRVLHEGTRPRVSKSRVVGDQVVVTLDLSAGERAAQVCFVLTLNEHGQVTRLQDYSSDAAAERDITLRHGSPLPRSPVSALIPFVHVADVEASVAFYRLLGFEPTETYAPEGRPVWAALQSEAARLMVAEAEAPIEDSEQAVLFYLYAHDLDGLRDHLVREGEVPGEIVDGSPGPRREMRVTDPDGYCLMIAQIDDDTLVDI